MDKEEMDRLLAIAIVTYPQGTKFHPISSVTAKPITNSIYVSGPDHVWSGNCICSRGNLYCNGAWAPIIDSVNNNYDIF